MKCLLARVFRYQNCKEILKYPRNIRRVVGDNGTYVNPEVRINQGFQFSHDDPHQLKKNTRGVLLF